MQLNLQLTNIAAIIQSTQTADYTIMAIAHKTCGMQIYPHPHWRCTDESPSGSNGTSSGSGAGTLVTDGMVSVRRFPLAPFNTGYSPLNCSGNPGVNGLSHRGVNGKRSGQNDTDSPFGSVWICSIGFVLVLLVTIPLGYYNLDDNIYVQIGAAVMLFFVLAGWGIGFAAPDHLVRKRSHYTYTPLLPVRSTLYIFIYDVSYREGCGYITGNAGGRTTMASRRGALPTT
jgi:hypothetical protein